MPRKPRINDIRKGMDRPPASKTEQTSQNTKIRLKAKMPAISKKNLLSPKSPMYFLRSNIYYLLILGVLLFLYLFKIRSLPPAGSEGSLSVSHNNLSDIDSIDFLPIKLVAVALDKIGIDNPLDIRLFSVFIMLVSLLFFYKLMVRWLGKRLAAVAVLLYGSSSWALAQSRHDNEFIMLAVFMPVLLYCGSLILNSSSKIVRVICSLIVAQLIFVPGGLWFILGSILALILRAENKARLKHLLLPFSVILATLIGYAALLFHLSLTGFPQLLKVGGLQVGELPTAGTVKANIIELPGQLFFSGLNDSSVGCCALRSLIGYR